MSATRMTSMPFIKLTVILLVAILALGIALAAGAERAWAGGNPELDTLMKGGTFTLSYKGKAKDMGYRDYSPREVDKEITDVKSSNAKVATAKVLKQSAYGGGTVYILRVVLKKAGTTELSFKYDGKPYRVSYVVKKYVNQLSTLKVGSKSYVSYCSLDSLNDHCYYASTSNVPVEAFSGKVVVKAKRGWKIDLLLGDYSEIKNGSKVEGCRSIGVLLSNKKTKQSEGYYLDATGASTLKAARLVA